LSSYDCAIVLEAVKTCENLHACSKDAIERNFRPDEREHFQSISEPAGFTAEKFYGHCEEVCKAGAYELHPARDILCGY
jgi:hypothetical protein